MTDPAESFRWGSALGISVVLFLICGAIYVLIGALTPMMYHRDVGTTVVITSSRADSLLFGSAPPDLLRGNRSLATFRSIAVNIIAGLLVAAGILIIAVAWFGLRGGQAWALGALVIAGMAVLPFWWVAFRPYGSAGIPLWLGDIPPFMTIPAALLVPAAILGWLGLR